MNANVAMTLMAGNIRLLGFELVQEIFVDHWEKIKHHLHMLTGITVQKYIDPEDGYVAANDQKFVVLFSKNDPGETARRPNVIAGEVNNRLAILIDGSEGIYVTPSVLELSNNPSTLQTLDVIIKSVEDVKSAKLSKECFAF